MTGSWTQLFAVTLPPWELMIRGTVMYWVLFVLFRFLLRRDVGSIAIADVLLLVLIADASQNAMAGGYESITYGIVLVGTIGGWNLLLDWLAFRFPAVRRILEPAPLPLVRDGRLLRQNMRRELVSVDELNAQLRQQGVDEYADIKVAIMESDGTVSVIKKQDDGSGKRGRSARERVV
ncbi:MAG: DUF421 domain-containing protein [Betaproteobacteria bacterium]|nr:DUF421 domain-containing protein [Betaproteobacteria bacterium]